MFCQYKFTQIPSLHQACLVVQVWQLSSGSWLRKCTSMRRTAQHNFAWLHIVIPYILSDTAPLRSRHFTKLCSSMHRGESMSEIHEIYEGSTRTRLLTCLCFRLYLTLQTPVTVRLDSFKKWLGWICSYVLCSILRLAYHDTLHDHLFSTKHV